MIDFNSFMPHGHCYLWQPLILWMHVISDAAIGLSYFSIPFAMAAYYRHKSKEISRLFAVVLWLFIIFILLCGTTHFLDILTTWVPAYLLEGIVKLMTAVVSLVTALSLWPLIPKVLLLPSPAQLQSVNDQLSDLNQNLEERIRVATAELTQKNLELEREVKEKNLIQKNFEDKADLLEIIVNSLNEGLICKTPFGDNILINSSFKAMFPEEIEISQKWGLENPSFLFSHDHMIPLAEQDLPINVALKGISVKDQIVLLQTPGNKKKFLNYSTCPVKNSSNQIIAGLVTIRDVTDSRSLQGLLKLALDAAPNGMIMVDSEGAIAYANKNAIHIFSYTSSELIGKKIESLVPKEIRTSHIDYRNRFMNQSVQREMGAGQDLYGVRRDGSKIPLEIGLTPIETPSGRFVVASIIDITDRKNYLESLSTAHKSLVRSEAQLKEVNSRLEQRNTELEQFVYTVSHDLRTPLVSIGAYAAKVLKGSAVSEDERLNKFVTRIISNVETMDMLLNDLLEFSKVSYKDIQLLPIPLDEAIDHSLAFVEQLIKCSGAELHKEVRSDLILTQLNLFTQLISNFISNSIKYRDPERPIKIWLSSSQSKDFIELKIRDISRGIPSDQHSKVFRIFERFHPDIKEGTGVGLPIIKKIVERHQWSISFESTDGEGTTFFIRIPRVQS